MRGTVQGVGFRPWAARHAVALGLAGTAWNERASLVVELEGGGAALDDFEELLTSAPPPAAIVASIEVVRVVAVGQVGFHITPSTGGVGPAGPVPVDVGVCAACLAEVEDPTDRRFDYPFSNCADCGPRYTIIRSLPYDRSSTTMAGFERCPACAAEYEDPGDRRFHAEPIACSACGPALTWETPDGLGSARGTSALDAASECLAGGGVVAVKGIGGYHLAARADHQGSVERLRHRKARDDKPFAVMVATEADAVALVHLDAAGLAALTSPRRPVVIAERVVGGAVADAVGAGSPDLGVLLAYTPLHHLLLARVGGPLVMTSGNRADEPIAYENEDARTQLDGLVDGYLHHDRPIHVRCDDSVVRAAGGHVQVVRRSRGYAPEPLRLPVPTDVALLAVGAERKSTVALAAGASVVASHHLGDLEHPGAHRAFVEAIAHLQDLTGIRPELAVHDLHPEYLSTKWALDGDLPVLGVQHHHAHAASCLVDAGRSAPVLALAFDGLGFGTDGTLWGGELLVADLRSSRRVGHLRTVALPGGAAAVREPWRMALAWVALTQGEAAVAALGPTLDPRWEAVLSLTRAPSTPSTSSGGRLFDAVAALAGLRGSVSYEGQAAVELEWAARSVTRTGAVLDGARAGDWVAEPPVVGPWVLDPAELVADALLARLAGAPAAAIASTFHERLAAGLARAAVVAARREGLDAVALTGGVFQNALLTALVSEAVAASGLGVVVHRHVPPNDGGISIGQAAVAAATS